MVWRHILFDLDGTLTDSAPGITNAIIYARKKWGLAPGENADYYKFIGPPMPESFERFWGFSHEDAVRFLADYREYFNTTGLYENAVYPGILPLLQSLREGGRRLYIATTKPTDSSRRIAERFGFAGYFSCISGSDPVRGGTKYGVIQNIRERCHPDMDSAVMVGDRSHDVEGAHGHGIPCIGVTYGFGGRAELEDAGADYIAESVSELSELLLSRAGRPLNI